MFRNTVYGFQTSKELEGNTESKWKAGRLEKGNVKKKEVEENTKFGGKDKATYVTNQYKYKQSKFTN